MRLALVVPRLRQNCGLFAFPVKPPNGGGAATIGDSWPTGSRAAPEVLPSAWKYAKVGRRSSPLMGVISRLVMAA